MFHGSLTPPGPEPSLAERYFGAFRYGHRALQLVWSTSARLTLLLAGCTLVAGLTPALAAWVGKLIVDSVVTASRTGAEADQWLALQYVGVEAGVILVLAAAQRGLTITQSLLRARLGHRVNVMILEKALTLELSQFEDSELYDQLTRARREASSRPLSLVTRTFALVQHGISLIAYGALLLQFSAWAMAIVVLAGLPGFFAEARFSGAAFRLFKWRSPETRKQAYLETVLAREDSAKEVKVFELGPILLGRYREIFERLYPEDRSLTLRRGVWGYLLGLLGTGAFYGAYAWIAIEAIGGHITLGAMTMYLIVFKQAQAAVSQSLTTIGGMYEDNLYLSTLYEFLEIEVPPQTGSATSGPTPREGIQFEGVSFTYPGATEPALSAVDLQIRPGEKLALVGENGSGKTTLIKLLTRLYQPDAGRILLDGRDLREWDVDALRHRIGVIFQDFVRYQLTVGENVGAGNVKHFNDEVRWEEAARQGMAHEFIERLPGTYGAQLGRWFAGGRELSGGQWQKIALSRAFMRTGADVLVLDEPTAAMDAQAEADLFEHVRSTTEGKMAVLISHRFSTVRLADQIVVLSAGRVTERGTHDELVAQGGTYARLFTLQAAAYQ